MPKIGIKVKVGKMAEGMLAALLADEYVLQLKARGAHWNVVGHDFAPMHAFFEGEYSASAARIDEVAERIRIVGGAAPASLKRYLGLARLSDDDALSTEGTAGGFVALLLADHEAICRQVRKDIATLGEAGDDVGTEDFLTGLLQQHEKAAWMLRAMARE